MPPFPRKGLERLRPAVHGGPDFAELGRASIAPDSLIDFSVGFNPLGPPPSLPEKLATVSIGVYPDSRATELREALARKLGVRPENIIAGNGSSELIWLSCLAYFGPRDRVIIPEPTFGEYERACLVAGSEPVKLKSLPPGFAISAEKIIDAARKHRARGIFLCNPNNPTGVYVSRAEVENILESLPDTLLVIDEAYVAFTENAWPSENIISRGNVLILRSMTKDYGIAGLRLGYALADESIISNLQKVCPPWNVNAVAQKAGIIVLGEEGHIERGRQVVKQARAFLFRELGKLGLEPIPSRTNFFLVRVGDAAALRRSLLEKGILVRDGTSFGLPEYVRLAGRPLPDCQKLVEALKRHWALGTRQKAKEIANGSQSYP